jgi:hypothetical protein
MQVSHNVTASNFWQHVNSARRTVDIDQDRAVEYVRRNCCDAKIFKLFLMATSIAVNQVRQKGNEVITVLAEFHQEGQSYPRDELTRVKMTIELRVETPGKKKLTPSHFYDITLLVNQEGMIVDVDLNSLAHQISKSLIRQ